MPCCVGWGELAARLCGDNGFSLNDAEFNLLLGHPVGGICEAFDHGRNMLVEYGI